MNFPEGKTFAFTILDDTDNATVQNVKPVYDLLYELGLRTTKSLWIYPPRDNFDGQCVEDPEYLAFLLELQDQGFELCSHCVGSGAFSRQEIISGFERFRELFGEYPRVHANHANNPDNLYWRPQDRFLFPLNHIIALLQRLKRPRQDQGGHLEESAHFWGNWAKEHLQFVRDLTFNDINTMACDPRMPYRQLKKEKYSNYWFSSSDGHTVRELNALTSPRNVNKLEREGGVCIVYTHFASGFVEQGRLNKQFADQMEALASREKGWFVPVGRLLEHLQANRQGVDSEPPPYLYRFRTELRWLRDRIVKQIRFGR